MHSKYQRILISHHWFKRKSNFAEWVDFAYWWSCIWKGLRLQPAQQACFCNVSASAIFLEVLITHFPGKQNIANYAPFIGQFGSDQVMLSDSFKLSGPLHRPRDIATYRLNRPGNWLVKSRKRETTQLFFFSFYKSTIYNPLVILYTFVFVTRSLTQSEVMNFTKLLSVVP